VVLSTSAGAASAAGTPQVATSHGPPGSVSIAPRCASSFASALGRDALALRRLDEEMLERIGIGDLAASDLDPDPGNQAAVLGNARRGVARLRGRQVLDPAERLEADRVGLDDSRRDDREGIDELRIGGRVLRQAPVARGRRDAAVAHQRPEIARAIVAPEGHRQDAGRDELA
jgi:hypothetical protein